MAKQQILIKMSEQEVREYTKVLADKISERAKLKENKKIAMRDYTETIEKLDSEINALAWQLTGEKPDEEVEEN